MCNFLSFFTSVRHNGIAIGDPRSHALAPVHSGVDDWRECVWEPHKTLRVRTTPEDDRSAYLATVFAKAKTRKHLARRLSPSVDRYGSVYHFNPYGLHDPDPCTPAIMRHDGTVFHYAYNRLHNPYDPSAPTIIWPDGSVAYHYDGYRHNTEGPAYIGANGKIEYYVDNRLHNAEGPAIIWPDGKTEYYLDDRRHNPRGPAVTWPDGRVEYWLFGRRVDVEDVNND